MKQTIIISVAITLIVIIGLAAVINYPSLSKNSNSKPFFVGVTYGGNNIQNAKSLIDKVTNYTNLFVLQSGLLKDDASAVNEIGDYAVSKGLHFAAYFDVLGQRPKRGVDRNC